MGSRKQFRVHSEAGPTERTNETKNVYVHVKEKVIYVRRGGNPWESNGNAGVVCAPTIMYDSLTNNRSACMELNT